MSKEEEKPAEGAEAKPKSKKKLIIIIVAVLVLVGGGAGAFLMGGKEEVKKDEAEEEHHEEEKHYQTVKLDTVIVNLSENATFLKTTMLLEYDPAVFDAAAALGAHGGSAGGEGHSGGEAAPKEGGMPSAMQKRKPMIDDAIIRVLSAKKAADVLSNEGKEQLKQELIEAINEAIGLEEPAVVNIYFVEFIIQ